MRNEAWVLEAFLTHCSSWADHIIIADQHSSDGSREIALRFPKVTLVDNPRVEMDMSFARNLLFQAVDKIEGDKIVFALDADEFLSEGFSETSDWKKILCSTPNKIFSFRWLNLINDYRHAFGEDMTFMEWACHLDPKTSLSSLYQQCEARAIHESRIPCIDKAEYIHVEEIVFVHLGKLCKARCESKGLLYQVNSVDKLDNPVSSITLYRAYHDEPLTRVLDREVAIESADGDNLSYLVDVTDNGQHYIDEMAAIFRREGFRKFRWLCIWDSPSLAEAGINYRPPFAARLLHAYLRATQKHRSSFWVRAVDKILKMVV